MVNWEPLSIEELHESARKNVFCPYFLQKDRVASADVIFMPYNYLIDPKIRENFTISFKDNILIFDEAHNIPGAAEDIASLEISES